MPIPVVSFIGVLVIYLVWTAATYCVARWAHKRIDAPNLVVFGYLIPLTSTTNSARNNIGYESGSASTDVPTANTSYYTRLQGMVRNGANAGDLQFRVAAENANNVSVRIGSVIKITQTN